MSLKILKSLGLSGMNGGGCSSSEPGIPTAQLGVSKKTGAAVLLALWLSLSLSFLPFSLSLSFETLEGCRFARGKRHRKNKVGHRGQDRPAFFRRDSLGPQRRRLRATTPVQRRFRAWHGRKNALLLKLSQADPSKRETGVFSPWSVYFWCLVSSKQSHICNRLRALSMCRGAGQSRRRRTMVSSDTQPRRNYCHRDRGRGMPWPSSFQGCDCSTVVQVLRLQNRHH